VFDDVDDLREFEEACDIARQERIMRGRVRIDAFRYVFLPLAKLRGRPLMGYLIGSDPDDLDPHIMTGHFTAMLNSLLDGRRVPKNICSEMLENHFESPLRIWCERLIVFQRVVRLEKSIGKLLASIRKSINDKKGIQKFLYGLIQWPRWLLHRINLTALRVQIDFAILLIGFFVRRRRNVVELAWYVDDGQLMLEVSNNAKIPHSLAAVAAERTNLVRESAGKDKALGRAEFGINNANRPLKEHLLSGAGLGMIMVASAAARFGGSLNPPTYDPQSGRTVAIFTADVERLPESA
jgi:hypothetical protein